MIKPDPTDTIGPLTPAEWCAFRLRDDDDLLQCCGVTSEFRDALFYVLRMGGSRDYAGGLFREAWQEMDDHGFPQGADVTPLLNKLRSYYIDRPEAKP